MTTWLNVKRLVRGDKKRNGGKKAGKRNKAKRITNQNRAH
jgi:hypothetical protein